MEIDAIAIWSKYQDHILAFGLKTLGALFVLMLGLRVSNWLAKLVREQAVKNVVIDDTLGNFFASLVQWSITAAVIVAVFQIFGVPATSLVAIIGALTLAIGLSLQGALGNIASGVMIMIFRPYKLGDFINTANVAGTVKDINLFQTVLATPDNVKIMVPNAQEISGAITNFSGFKTRRVDITFSIDYKDDMDKAIALIHEMIAEDSRILSEPKEPFVKVFSLNASSIDIISRSWVNSEDYWDVRFDLIKRVKEIFDANNITIPFPQSTITYKNQ